MGARRGVRRGARSDFEGLDFFESEGHGDGGGEEAEEGDENPGEDEAPGLAAFGEVVGGEAGVHGQGFGADDEDEVGEAEDETERAAKPGDDAGRVVIALVGG